MNFLKCWQQCAELKIKQERNMTEEPEQPEQEQERDRLARIEGYKEMMAGLDAPNLSPGSYSFHEAVHTSFLAHDSIERTLLDHPVIFHDKELYDKATEISEKLWELYQIAALKHMPEEDKITVTETKA